MAGGTFVAAVEAAGVLVWLDIACVDPSRVVVGRKEGKRERNKIVIMGCVEPRPLLEMCATGHFQQPEQERAQAQANTVLRFQSAAPIFSFPFLFLFF